MSPTRQLAAERVIVEIHNHFDRSASSIEVLLGQEQGTETATGARQAEPGERSPIIQEFKYKLGIPYTE